MWQLIKQDSEEIVSMKRYCQLDESFHSRALLILARFEWKFKNGWFFFKKILKDTTSQRNHHELSIHGHCKRFIQIFGNTPSQNIRFSCLIQHYHHSTSTTTFIIILLFLQLHWYKYSQNTLSTILPHCSTSRTILPRTIALYGKFHFGPT